MKLNLRLFLWKLRWKLYHSGASETVSSVVPGAGYLGSLMSEANWAACSEKAGENIKALLLKLGSAHHHRTLNGLERITFFFCSFRIFYNRDCQPSECRGPLILVLMLWWLHTVNLFCGYFIMVILLLLGIVM